MPALRSSVLIIHHPEPESIAFGADFATDFNQAGTAITEFSYPVVVLPSSADLAPQVLNFLELVNQASPLSQRVIIQNDTPSYSLAHVVNTGSVFKILPSFTDPNFDLTIQEALAEYRLLQQNTNLLRLVNEQNERLRRLSIDLEERVEVRRKSLEDAKEKLLVTNHRVEALHRALVVIHQAGSIAEMERLINEALSAALGLSWTRILFRSQTSLDAASSLSQQHVALHIAPLMRDREILGQIYFARGPQSPFTRDENAFLSQVAEGVSLAIARLTKLEESETLKQQWEATFDAILEPVSVIDSDHTIVRINRSFAEHSGLEPEKVIGTKCHVSLFGRDNPCEGCVLGTEAGTTFRLSPCLTAGGRAATFDVFSQEIQFKPEERSLYVNMYHDVSSQLRYERQILETAKMAELGTIGSSIAHELNNPLGGMLSFLQLIKMDLKGDEPWADDIIEMESGARRCRDIVQSLLGFTRKSSHDSTEIVDLREAIEQALKITELQTRAIGIHVIQNLSDEALTIRGQFNFISQVIRNFLQMAQEAIAERIKIDRRQRGEIRLRLYPDGDWFIVEISDNGIGLVDPLNNPGLGLTVAQQIINEHGGRLEMTSTKGAGTSAKISFPRPVFEA